jgi:hypothetical protein
LGAGKHFGCPSGLDLNQGLPKLVNAPHGSPAERCPGGVLRALGERRVSVNAPHPQIITENS